MTGQHEGKKKRRTNGHHNHTDLYIISLDMTRSSLRLFLLLRGHCQSDGQNTEDMRRLTTHQIIHCWQFERNNHYHQRIQWWKFRFLSSRKTICSNQKWQIDWKSFFNSSIAHRFLIRLLQFQSIISVKSKRASERERGRESLFVLCVSNLDLYTCTIIFNDMFWSIFTKK